MPIFIAGYLEENLAKFDKSSTFMIRHEILDVCSEISFQDKNISQQSVNL